MFSLLGETCFLQEEQLAGLEHSLTGSFMSKKALGMEPVAWPGWCVLPNLRFKWGMGRRECPSGCNPNSDPDSVVSKSIRLAFKSRCYITQPQVLIQVITVHLYFCVLDFPPGRTRESLEYFILKNYDCKIGPNWGWVGGFPLLDHYCLSILIVHFWVLAGVRNYACN